MNELVYSICGLLSGLGLLFSVFGMIFPNLILRITNSELKKDSTNEEYVKVITKIRINCFVAIVIFSIIGSYFGMK